MAWEHPLLELITRHEQFATILLAIISTSLILPRLLSGAGYPRLAPIIFAIVSIYLFIPWYLLPRQDTGYGRLATLLFAIVSASLGSQFISSPNEEAIIAFEWTRPDEAECAN